MWWKVGVEARQQKSSMVAKIIRLSRGRCDVQLPDGREMRGIHFALGYSWPVDTWVTIERVKNDWQVIGNGPHASEVYVTPTPPVDPTLLLSLWAQSEANPQCNRVTRDRQAPPTWQGEFGATLIGTMPRYYDYDTGLQDGCPSNLHSLISHEGVVLGETTVAAMGCLYNADASAIVGYLVREWELGTETVFEWIHVLNSTIGTLATNNAQRRQGYLFFDRQSNSYTVACPQGLLLCTRGNAPTPTCCAWAHLYGSIPPESSVSVAGGYAMAGAWPAYDAAFDSLSTHACVDCYARGLSEWAHVAQVQLGNKLTGCDYLEACGQWDPFSSDPYPETINNTRWPYLASSQEWLVWISGTAGDRNTRIDKASAALLAIKATTGAVRTIEAYDAPLIKVPAFAEAQADHAERLTYQSSLHPENWIALGYPSFAYDGGGATGWGGGPLFPGAVGEGTYHPGTTPATYPDTGTPGYYSGGDIPEADLGYGHWENHWTYHEENMDPYKWVWGEDPVWVPGTLASANDYPGCVPAHRVTQYLDVYAGWDTGRDPTAAKESQRVPEPFPRGIIDTTDGKCYECVRHSQWIANEGAGAWPGTAYYEPGAWPYTYTGFEDFASTGIHSGSVTRVYKRARTSHGMFVWENGFDRPILRQYSGSALLGTLDLTREFPRVDENGKHRIDYRSPTILEWVAAGNYLWVLAADWWAADDQRLGMILINKTSLLEVDRIDLSPIPGSLWLIETDWAGSGGRPQIWGGVDATGEPWAQVSAWWSGWHDSVIQEVRYVSSALSKAIISHTGWHDGGTQPARLTTVANIAIKPGAQFWLDAGVDLKKTTD